MAFYAPMLSSDKRQLVMMKATTAPETDASWSNVDTGILVSKDGVASMWAFEHNKVAYDFDASDAAATDPDTVWTNEANAFDGDDSTDATCATNGTSTTNETKGEGTGAPASGDTIGEVSIMVRSEGTSSDVLGIFVTTDAGGETLLNTTQAVTTSAADYSFVLSVPSGGWTWAKIQALEVTYWKDSGAGTLTVSRGQAIVTVDSDIYVATQENVTARVALHIFDTTTDTWTTRDEQVAVIGDSAEFDDVSNYGNAVSLGVRSDGDVVVLLSAEDTGVNSKILYIIRTGGSWGTLTNFDAADDAGTPTFVGLGTGSELDRITFAYEYNNAIAAANSISSTNVIGTRGALDSFIDSANHIFGASVLDSNNEGFVPYIDLSNQVSVAQFTADSSISLGTGHLDVSDVAVEGNGATAVPFILACLVISPDDEIHLIYADDATQDLWMTSNVIDGGGVDCEIVDAVTVTRLSANYLASTIGILYSNNGTVTYKEVEMTVPALTALSQAEYPDQNYYIGPYSI